MKIYQLTSENLTGLGGPMGSEHTSTNWQRFFRSIASAKRIAAKDYKKEGGEEKIEWVRDGKEIRSQDLNWVMYLGNGL